ADRQKLCRRWGHIRAGQRASLHHRVADGMTPASLVTGQVSALDQSLAQANGLLDSDEQTQHSLSNLLQRVKGRFRNDLLKLRRECTGLSQKAQGGNLNAVDLGRLAQLEKDAAD